MQSVTPLDGGCLSQDLPPSGTETWRVQQNHSYRVRLVNVTECSDETIHVHLFDPFRREDDPEDCYHPRCLPAHRVGDGEYEFDVAFGQVESKGYFIRYCTSADCSSGGVLARRSDGGMAPSLIHLWHFSPNCDPLRSDKICYPSCCQFYRFEDLELPCNPSTIPDCSELINRIRCDDPGGQCCNFEVLSCENGTDEPDPDRGGCWFRRRVTYQILDRNEFEVCTVEGFIRWQVDGEGPTITLECPPDRDLGCNPVRILTCDDILRETRIIVEDNCPHEPPTYEVNCSFEDVRDGCIVTRIFTVTVVARDKCGNESQASCTTRVRWNEDTEPPPQPIFPPDPRPCNPPEEEIPDCGDVIIPPDNCPHEPPTVECREDDRREGCFVIRTITVVITDKCGNRTEASRTYRWQVDDRPPEVNNVPEGPPIELPCNSEPTCPWVIQTYNIHAKDNCQEHQPPTLYCEPGPVEPDGGCFVRQTFTFWAVDKCGNRSRDYHATFRWQVDDRPPEVNNVPETDKLPCNTRPTCELLIARHNIHAKDNCAHEPPTLHCEPGPVENIGNCRFRQVFTFWAVDKCGNRSRDYRVTVFWKEDTEPPVLHNVPEDLDLGCNPTHIPDCDEISAGVTATDNCDPNVQVTCTYRDIVIGCLHIRSFILAAADECGNVTTRKVVVSWIEDREPPIARCPDNITVQAQFPDCLVQVTWRAKADDACDPNPRISCDPPSGSFFPLGTTVVTCTATDRCGNRSTCQFTVTVLGYLCGIKFEDRNGNGVQDPGEPGLPGWTIELLQNGNVIATTVTGADGRFCFLGLLEGVYEVREVLQPGWQNTTPISVRRSLPRDCGKLIYFGNRRLPAQ